MEVNGTRLRIPADWTRIVQNVEHAQISNDSWSHAYFNPRYLLEFAHFCEQMPEAAFRRAFAELRHIRLATGSWIYLCEAYLGVSPPVRPPVRALDRLQAARIKRAKNFGRESNAISLLSQFAIRSYLKVIDGLLWPK